MILIKMRLHRTAAVARDQGTVQPLVGMEQHWGHAGGVGAIEDLLVYLRHPLPRMNLANVGQARQPRTAGIDRPQTVKHLGLRCCRSASSETSRTVPCHCVVAAKRRSVSGWYARVRRIGLIHRLWSCLEADKASPHVRSCPWLGRRIIELGDGVVNAPAHAPPGHGVGCADAREA